ncbi:MAG TPA: hypothetical protein VFO82_00975 [Steroidobacteraceae bacterium]|nr:hypothetical protein [Steroidobacteraceae bacterium]
MMNIVRAAWLCLLVAPLIHAQSAPNQVHTPPQSDPGVYSGRLKVNYPTRYEPATIEEVRAVLERVMAPWPATGRCRNPCGWTVYT